MKKIRRINKFTLFEDIQYGDVIEESLLDKILEEYMQRTGKVITLILDENGFCYKMDGEIIFSEYSRRINNGILNLEYIRGKIVKKKEKDDNEKTVYFHTPSARKSRSYWDRKGKDNVKFY